MDNQLELNWDNFNSCVLIEVSNHSNQSWYSGFAIREDVILTTSEILNYPIFKILIHHGGKKYEIEDLELHPKIDVIRIKLKKPLPKTTIIYSILKDQNRLIGKLIYLSRPTSESGIQQSICAPKFHSMSKDGHYINLQ